VTDKNGEKPTLPKKQTKLRRRYPTKVRHPSCVRYEYTQHRDVDSQRVEEDPSNKKDEDLQPLLEDEDVEYFEEEEEEEEEEDESAAVDDPYYEDGYQY